MEEVASISSSCPMSGPIFWDPGENRRYDPKTRPSIHSVMSKLTPVYHELIGACNTVKVGHQSVTSYLARRIRELSSVSPEDGNDALNNAAQTSLEEEYEVKTDLDSHANVAVIGSEAYIIEETGETASVQPYSSDYDTKEIPIVHAGVLYQCPYTGFEYILVVRNALYVPSMKVDLIPPF